MGEEKFYDFSGIVQKLYDQVNKAKHIGDKHCARMIETMIKKIEKLEEKINN